MPKSYIPYLYNADTSVKWTIGAVPLVFVLKRFDCTLRSISNRCSGNNPSLLSLELSSRKEQRLARHATKLNLLFGRIQFLFFEDKSFGKTFIEHY